MAREDLPMAVDHRVCFMELTCRGVNKLARPVTDAEESRPAAVSDYRTFFGQITYLPVTNGGHSAAEVTPATSATPSRPSARSHSIQRFLFARSRPRSIPVLLRTSVGNRGILAKSRGSRSRKFTRTGTQRALVTEELELLWLQLRFNDCRGYNAGSNNAVR